ncbi:hypothetical protein [Micromonospora sp. NBC_01813]|uniref:hypothetical protein n=1 Tax=Micromonospora sp. NBC_01813 TaxID=2975988 RepID=UPI002DD98DBF|nr:hypothetical protein [Micromonospora sp. NBC_01813]WSA11521.1 hypothetical protein OG958_12485 [Micromonospora sp. NBC_01813]
MKTYRVTWREITDHEIDLTSAQLAELLGADVEQVEDDPKQTEWDSENVLADELSEYSDASCLGVDRVSIKIEEL